MIKSAFLCLFLIVIAAGQRGPAPIRISVGIDPHIVVKGLSFGEIKQCVKDAEKAWEDVANVDFYYERYPDLRVVSEPLRPGRVAECDVPAGKIRFDGLDAVTGLKDGVWTKDFFTKVMVHELGHALGLDHVDANVEPDSIMKDAQPLPIKPGRGDIFKLYQKYGPKRRNER